MAKSGRKPVRSRSSGRVGRNRGKALATGAIGSVLRVIRRTVLRNAMMGVQVQRAAMKRGFSADQARSLASATMRTNIRRAFRESIGTEARRLARSGIRTIRQRYEQRKGRPLTRTERAAVRVGAAAAALATRRATYTALRIARDPATRRYARIAVRLARDAYRQRYGRNMPIAIPSRILIEGTFRYSG